MAFTSCSQKLRIFLNPQGLVAVLVHDGRGHIRKDVGTIEGHIDPYKLVEFGYWEDFTRHKGITDEQARKSTHKFRATYDTLEFTLAQQSAVIANEISLLDIAWFIDTHHLTTAGYPFARHRPNVYRWHRGLSTQQVFTGEVTRPLPLQIINKLLHAAQALKGTGLEKVAGP